MKSRGRPREFQEVVSVRLPLPLHDALCRKAGPHGRISDLIRLALVNFVSQKSPAPQTPSQ